jgi:hopanoid biosynthesis associated protein HpnK
MKRLIINADDFGLSPGVNRGIVEAFRSGVLTSATTMVQFEHFDDAVRLARENPELPLGVHLSLLWGRPVSNPALVRSLVDREGRFPNTLTALAGRYATGRLSMSAVRAEFRRQIQKFVDAGLEPTHVDTHKHVHCLTGILECLVSVAAEFGVDRVRLPQEGRLEEHAERNGSPPAAGSSLTGRLRLGAVRVLTRGHRRLLEIHGMRTTDHFLGIAWQSRLNSESIRFILRGVKHGVTELMCHPGYADTASDEFSTRPPDREAELRALTDPATRGAIEDHGIELVSYRAV